jgi:RAB protein geranylgeranyltransferase component A
MIFKLKDNFNLILCDYLDEFSDFKYLTNLYYPINKRVDGLDTLLDEVTVELEKRLNILNEEGMDNYLSLNKVLISKKKKSSRKGMRVLC